MVYQSEILSALQPMISETSAQAVQMAIFSGDIEQLKSTIMRLLHRSSSYFDGTTESFYHGLMLGLLSMSGNKYHLESNLEFGNGRFDLCLVPFDRKDVVILLELKAIKRADSAKLLEATQVALQQIDRRSYIDSFKINGYTQFLKLGVAFSGKDVEIAAENR